MSVRVYCIYKRRRVEDREPIRHRQLATPFDPSIPTITSLLLKNLSNKVALTQHSKTKNQQQILLQKIELFCKCYRKYILNEPRASVSPFIEVANAAADAIDFCASAEQHTRIH